MSTVSVPFLTSALDHGEASDDPCRQWDTQEDEHALGDVATADVQHRWHLGSQPAQAEDAGLLQLNLPEDS
jgi:hypothetical protein